MENNQRKADKAAYMRQWRLDNLERAREISRAGSAKYNAANPEKRKETSRISARKHRVPRVSMDETARNDARELARKRYRERAERDPDYVPRKKERSKKWRLANPELAKQVAREATARWRAANPEKVRKQIARSMPKKKAQQQAKRRDMRMALLEFFGGKCVKCGFTDGRALHLDHIHGNGNTDRKAGKGNKWDQYALVQSDPDAARAKYQLLCANCNTIKQFENGEYRTVR